MAISSRYTVVLVVTNWNEINMEEEHNFVGDYMFFL